MRSLLTILSLCVLAACGAPTETAVQAGSEETGPSTPDLSLYDGRTLTYIVATGPGGNYDAYGRLIGRFMQKYLPGSRVIVRNVPGAGHIVGANTLYASRPDGLTIGTFNTGLIYTQLLEREGVQFDLAQMEWIGSAAHDVRVIILPTNSPYGSFQEYIDSGDVLRVAAAGVGSAAYNDTRIVAEALHLNVEIIPGFEGNEGQMSMMRGEVTGLLGWRRILRFGGQRQLADFARRSAGAGFCDRRPRKKAPWIDRGALRAWTADGGASGHSGRSPCRVAGSLQTRSCRSGAASGGRNP